MVLGDSLCSLLWCGVSPNRLFIIKTIPSSEAKLLRTMLPQYYNYVANNPETYIMRYCGLHSIRMHFGEEIFVIVIGVNSSSLYYYITTCIEL